MNKTALLAVMPMILTGSAAFAEATEDGAARLTEVFQTYLSATEGVVSVEVDGDDYTLTLDAAPFIAKAATEGGTASLTPLIMTLSDNEDGTWNVAQDQAVTMTFSMPGAADVRQEIASLKTEGVFDEELMTFTSSKGEITGIKVTEAVTAEGQAPVAVDIAVASATFDITGVAGAAGGVDNTVAMTMTGLSENFTTPAEAGMPPMQISVTADSLTDNGKVDGLRPDAFYKAMAWFVANPDQPSMMANKGAMKTILSEGMPFFSQISSNPVLKNVTVVTPMGNVGIAELGIAIDMNGLVKDGKVREAISISGLTLPEGVIPAWAIPILPKNASFDFQVTDFDAAAAATVALGLFDLAPGAEPDEAFNQAMLKALLPDGTVAIGLNPGAIAGDGYELTYQGEMIAGPDMAVPTGKATITLTGIETLQAAMAAAPDDIKGQAMMGVGMAQGMAKQEGDKLVWEIDALTPGSLSVNGTQMMGGN